MWAIVSLLQLLNSMMWQESNQRQYINRLVLKFYSFDFFFQPFKNTKNFSWPMCHIKGDWIWPTGCSSPTHDFIFYISVPGVQVNCFLHLVILYDTDNNSLNIFRESSMDCLRNSNNITVVLIRT